MSAEIDPALIPPQPGAVDKDPYLPQLIRTRRVIRAAGTVTEYTKHQLEGAPEGDGVIIAPGYLATEEFYFGLARAVAARKTVYTLEQRHMPHGVRRKASHLLRPQHLLPEQLSAVALDSRDQDEQETFHFVGHSRGFPAVAATANILIASGNARMVRSVTSVAGAGTTDHSMRELAFGAYGLGRELATNRGALLANLDQEVDDWGFFGHELDTIVRNLPSIVSEGIQVSRARARAGITRLYDAGVPFLGLYFLRDPLFHAERAASTVGDLAASFSVMEHVPQAGHMAPQVFTADVAAELDKAHAIVGRPNLLAV